jgi:hypothetical protein
MSNGTWKRTTPAERRKARQVRYAHVSVNIGVIKDPVTGMLTPTRTSKGEGSTATRKIPKSGAPRKKGHDWAGAYLGKPASVESAQRARRNAKRNTAWAEQRAAYFAAKELEGALNV